LKFYLCAITYIVDHGLPIDFTKRWKDNFQSRNSKTFQKSGRGLWGRDFTHCHILRSRAPRPHWGLAIINEQLSMIRNIF